MKFIATILALTLLTLATAILPDKCTVEFCGTYGAATPCTQVHPFKVTTCGVWSQTKEARLQCRSLVCNNSCYLIPVRGSDGNLYCTPCHIHQVGCKTGFKVFGPVKAPVSREVKPASEQVENPASRMQAPLPSSAAMRVPGPSAGAMRVPAPSAFAMRAASSAVPDPGPVSTRPPKPVPVGSPVPHAVRVPAPSAVPVRVPGPSAGAMRVPVLSPVPVRIAAPSASAMRVAAPSASAMRVAAPSASAMRVAAPSAVAMRVPTAVPETIPTLEPTPTCSVPFCTMSGRSANCMLEGTKHATCADYAKTDDKERDCDFACVQVCVDPDEQPVDNFGKKHCSVCHLMQASCASDFKIFLKKGGF